ncbi:MAG: hypothetical protein V7L25_15880 [Nostoc sp.]|uniref:hypothetical protein n=1 Tax=Nostoc sp. TaxID=1180 RepID=UPI002FF2957C
MSRLIVSSPGIIGTSGSDLVVGKEDNVFPAIGIEVLKKGVIDTQAGNDTIKGNATLDGGAGSDKLILPDFKSDYIITGTSNNYTIKRDQFTLNVLNAEEIVFLGVPPR